MKSTKPKEVTPKNAWYCETCKTEEMTHEGMLAHLQEAHGVETKGLKGRKEMLMHMDGDTWFGYQWKVTIASDKSDVILTNSTMQPRAKNDMMRFA